MTVTEQAAPARTHASTLKATDVVVEFPVGRGQKVHAVSGVSLEVPPGTTLGILGESGCGKSTIGRALIQLPPPDSGSVRLGDLELTELGSRDLRRARARMQIIMQDPVSALNPRRKVKDLVWEGRSIWGHDGETPKEVLVDDMLRSVGLDPEAVRDKHPHELSGGQCQRVCIARALMMDPEVLICDEPVSSLDVSVQAQILNLLETSARSFGLSMVFIAHDVSVVKNISDQVMVMYLGKACEVVPSDEMHRTSVHPYTRLLLASIPGEPQDHPHAQQVSVELPSPLDPPSGCRFRTRCPIATDRCAAEEPRMREIAPGHTVACHHVAVGAGK
ncbi:ATP-binding cassette domain-containing protein [Nocardioides sp. IC4_145]|uniref:oligopeptide/dipeptide ABC transporter ATP-binding protein n=1 Tax=Nocardioides sp. IC4_145 TaxID=2714037 RepID=UPI00140DE218|nr:oligopeptide/dipeptide ABC transporter ATP-binding protein [Nocardioides sp. IC4_145]NHC23373.1 ATP-binding cassette domain-containing protein [Nocardioides sp. IC4_145]